MHKHHVFPLQEGAGAKVYIFNVVVEPSPSTGGWRAYYPPHDEDTYVEGGTKGEVLAIIQASLEHIAKERARDEGLGELEIEVIATDRSEATVVGRPMTDGGNERFFIPDELRERFVTEILNRYGEHHEPEADPRAAALFEAIYQACQGRSSLDHIDPSLLEYVAVYAHVAAREGTIPRNSWSEEKLRIIIAAFIQTIAMTLYERAIEPDAEGRLFVNVFEVPAWFAEHLEKEFQHHRRHRCRLRDLMRTMRSN